MLIFAIITITLALVFYTIGVFGERRSGVLKSSHVVIFWIGFICDTLGTFTMSRIAQGGIANNSNALHGITGMIAIVLMFLHALWATVVIYKNDTHKKKTFHKFSIVVWLIWLIPYFIGMFMGMSK